MDSDLQRYAENLRTKKAAASYSTKYERIWHKRLSDRQERRVIRRALERTSGPYERILDMPCGAGRLTCELLKLGAPIVGADYSSEQMAFAAERYAGEDITLVEANALKAPFKDDEFSLVLSVRLSHHIADVADRERYLRELMRISKRWIIVSIFDHDSVKNLIRRARTSLRLTKKRGKFTMTMARVAEVAAEEGWTMQEALPLSRLFSGHKFVILRHD